MVQSEIGKYELCNKMSAVKQSITVQMKGHKNKSEKVKLIFCDQKLNVQNCLR